MLLCDEREAGGKRVGEILPCLGSQLSAAANLRAGATARPDAMIVCRGEIVCCRAKGEEHRVEVWSTPELEDEEHLRLVLPRPLGRERNRSRSCAMARNSEPPHSRLLKNYFRISGSAR